MANSWSTKRIDEIAQVVDSRHKTPQYSDDGYPMVRVVDVKGGVLQLKDTKRVNEEVYADFSKGRDPEIGDLIISRVGSYGNVAYVNSSEKFCLGQNTALIIPEDKSRYLYYALTSPQIKAQIDEMVVGAVQKTISLKTIKSLQIPEPPSEVKTKISKVLSTIDDKIELNRKTNQTLEQMAQALFKSWFVDFDPVFDNALASGMAVNDFPEALQKKAQSRQKQRQQIQQQIANGEPSADKKADAKPLPNDIQQLFPSEFEQTNDSSIGINGWIPKGWRYSELSELIGVKHGYAYKGEFFSDEPTHDILLTPGNVAVGGGFKGDKLKFYSGPLLEDYIFTKGDMYITMTDLSKAGDTLGFPALVPSIDGLTFHHNQRLGKVEFKSIKQFGAEFIYRCLCSREYRSYIVASATGTTVKHTSPTKILKHKVTNSGGVIEPIFDNYVKNFTAKKELNNSNSIDLAKTRDYLLPKLISGELTMPTTKDCA